MEVDFGLIPEGWLFARTAKSHKGIDGIRYETFLKCIAVIWAAALNGNFVSKKDLKDIGNSL